MAQVLPISALREMALKVADHGQHARCARQRSSSRVRVRLHLQLLDYSTVNAWGQRLGVNAWGTLRALLANLFWHTYFPSCSSTASHRATVSALEARSDGFCRTAVWTMTSFEAGSTRII